MLWDEPGCPEPLAGASLLYLTPEETHRIAPAAENTREHLFLRLLWETGARVSEAVALRLGDISRDGIRVLGRGSVERVVHLPKAFGPLFRLVYL